MQANSFVLVAHYARFLFLSEDMELNDKFQHRISDVLIVNRQINFNVYFYKHP